MNRGVTLYLAVIILTASMAIAFGIADIYYGELRLSQGADKSYEAFYQANTGIECALYYDFHNPHIPNGTPYNSYFDPLTDFASNRIQCGNVVSASPVTHSVNVDGDDIYSFSYDDVAANLFFDVTVTKKTGSQIVDSVGRNICSTCSGIKVERGIRNVIGAL
jgi:hypothetical protein